MTHLQSLLTHIVALAPQLASAWIASLWQGAALGLAVFLALRLLPRTAARTRFLIWFSAFAGIAALPLLSLLGSLVSGASTVSLASPPSRVSSAMLLSARWATGICLAWLAAAAFQLALLAHDLWKLRNLYRTSTPIPRASLPAGLATLLSHPRRVQLRVSSQVDTPSVVGFFRPAILLPEWMENDCNPEQLAQVVMHEVAHLRRADDWTNLLQKVVRALQPLSPALYCIERKLCMERELACDEAVLAAAVAPRDYASCLVTLAGKTLHQRTTSLAPGAIAHRSELGRRVENILQPARRLGVVAAASIASAFTLATAMGATALSRCPQMVAFVADPQVNVADKAPEPAAHISSNPGAPLETAASKQDRAENRTGNGGRLIPAAYERTRQVRRMNAQPALSGTHPATPAATSTHPSAPLVSQQASVSANAAPQQLWVFSLSPANAGAELELTSLILAADQPGNSDAGSAQAKSTSHSLATRPPQARPAFLQYDPIRHGWIIVQI